MADPTDRFLDTDMNEIRRRLGQDNEMRVLDTPVGESVYDRISYITNSAATSGDLLLAGFTARASQNISQVRVWTTGTAAAATPTLVRIGVYQRNSATNLLTLVASTPSDLTLLAATNTTYTKAFSALLDKVAGVDYMVGLLVVSAAAMPTLAAPASGWSTAYLTDSLRLFPQVTGKVAAQADLPATIAGATITTTPQTFHALLLQ